MSEKRKRGREDFDPNRIRLWIWSIQTPYSKLHLFYRNIYAEIALKGDFLMSLVVNYLLKR